YKRFQSSICGLQFATINTKISLPFGNFLFKFLYASGQEIWIAFGHMKSLRILTGYVNSDARQQVPDLKKLQLLRTTVLWKFLVRTAKTRHFSRYCVSTSI